MLTSTKSCRTGAIVNVHHPLVQLCSFAYHFRVVLPAASSHGLSGTKMMYWTNHLLGGPRRVNHAAVTIGKNIFTFGGYCSGVDYNTFKPIDIHILDTGNDALRRLLFVRCTCSLCGQSEF